MLFNSWPFLILVIIAFVIYYVPIFRKIQVYILLLVSAVFYAYNSFPLLSVLLISAFLNAFISYGTTLRYPKLCATTGVVLNLAMLCIFKYSGLLVSSISSCFSHSEMGNSLIMLPLPLGISFYTFSGISLVIDAYRGEIDLSKEKTSFKTHLKHTLLYICFFPKLLSGPIARADDFFKEISPKFLRDIRVDMVFKSLIVGYFLKMVIADNLKDYTYWMTYPYFEYRGSGSLLLLLFGYTMQIFADFAGYSLIAIGIAALFGYRLPQNFNFPYISSSFREFWKRWHITLSQFLMNYLYISLGGNRKGKARTYVNLFLTMALGGFWHGAAWSYLVWGALHGLALAIERALCGRRDNCVSFGNGCFFRGLSHLTSIAIVFTFVSFGWLLFMLPDFSQAMQYVACIYQNYGKVQFVELKFYYIVLYSIPIIIYHLIYYYRETCFVKNVILKYSYVLYAIMMFLILTNSGSADSFVYFQF